MQEVARNIWAGLTTSSWLDQVNLVLGIVGVWLMIRRTLWAFPVGLLAVAVQGVLFFRAHFPADAMLQVFFFVTLAWGWWHWVHDRGAAPELPVTALTWRGRGLAIAAAAIGMIAWVLATRRWMGAVMPWRDAFIAAFQVVAQVLQARKKLENWPLWIAANGVAIVSYWSAAMAYTAFLFTIYLVLAVLGWREWSRAMRRADG